MYEAGDRANHHAAGDPFPARQARPEEITRQANQFMEYAGEFGWLRHSVLFARGWKKVKRKGPPKEMGKQYSIIEGDEMSTMLAVRLVLADAVDPDGHPHMLVAVWVDGKFHKAFQRYPIRSYGYREAQRYVKENGHGE